MGNFRLLLFAQSPFNKWSLGSSALAFFSYIIWLLALSEIRFFQKMQWTVKGLALEPTVVYFMHACPDCLHLGDQLAKEFFSSGECLGAVAIGFVIAVSVDCTEKFVRLKFFPTELDKTRAKKET